MKKTAKYTLIVLVLIYVGLLIIGDGFGAKNTSNYNEPILFAHRGVTVSTVENSIESFKYSDDLGFNAIETDISCTKDGKLIIFHDKTCKRLLGNERNINDVSWEELQNKRLVYDGELTENKVLSLEQFFAQTNRQKILYIDMKNTGKSIGDSLLLRMDEINNYNNIIIADESLLFLWYLKLKNPKVKIALEGFNKGKEWLYYIIPKELKPDFYASFLSKVDENHMKFLRENNLEKNKIVYGVTSKNISEVYKLGIQNIIFDYNISMGKLKDIKHNIAEKR